MVKLCLGLYAQCADSDRNPSLNAFLSCRFVLRLYMLFLQLAFKSRQLLHLFLKSAQQRIVEGLANGDFSHVILWLLFLLNSYVNS